MSVLLFKLRNVPVDEANDVRELLESNHIEYYETSAGNWGISTPAIWLKHRDDLEKSRALIDAYQQERGVNQREAYEKQRQAGEHRTIVHAFRENPGRFIAYIVFIVLLLYFSIKPFISLGN